MKRTEIKSLDVILPSEIRTIVTRGCVYDSSSSPEARVYMIDADGGYFLKTASAGTLKTEAKMDEYFYKKGIGADVLYYGTHEGVDLLLTRRLRGEDATHADYIGEPRRLATLLGENLRALHELSYDGCPIKNRTVPYIATVEQAVKEGNFSQESLASYSRFGTHKDAYEAFCDGKDALRCDTLIHGDFCLPNIILDAWRPVGYIDLGCGGVGDRHIDIFWGLWTLNFNLGTDGYGGLFLDAYGRDKIDNARLVTVSAAESLI